VETHASFRPAEDELYLLGPTTPSRVNLAAEVHARFGLRFDCLVHPAASVSGLAFLSPGCFVGAGSVIAPGVHLGEHVFVNRCASIGHDTRVGSYTRIQPGAHTASLSRIGRGVSIGIGACLVDRLTVGDNTVIGAGTVVTRDLPCNVVAWGNPAEIQRSVDNPVFHGAG
jgi:UDP-3-O-[3-hydroxymyristoyl] glucosamine N-acyltransferase